MRVPVEDEDPLSGAEQARRGDGEVVEQTKAARPVRRRVVTGRADDAERGARLAAAEPLDRVEARTRRDSWRPRRSRRSRRCRRRSSRRLKRDSISIDSTWAAVCEPRASSAGSSRAAGEKRYGVLLDPDVRVDPLEHGVEPCGPLGVQAPGIVAKEYLVVAKEVQASPRR